MPRKPPPKRKKFKTPFPKKGMRFEQAGSLDQGTVTKVSRKEQMVYLTFDADSEDGLPETEARWTIDEWRERCRVGEDRALRPIGFSELIH